MMSKQKNATGPQVDQNRGDEDGRISQAQSDVQSKDTKSLPTAQELLEGQAKWWKERVEQAQEAQGWAGRNLRNQSELINMCMGMEQDITFLLRYVRSLTELIDLRLDSPETKEEL